MTENKNEKWIIIFVNGFGFEVDTDQIVYDFDDPINGTMWLGPDDEHNILDEIWKIWAPEHTDEDEDDDLFDDTYKTYDLFWENPFYKSEVDKKNPYFQLEPRSSIGSFIDNKTAWKDRKGDLENL
jgi:hypothetical protein